MTTEYPKPHQSPSQVSTYEKCGRMYYYRYVQKVPAAATRAQIAGSAAHRSREEAMKRKLAGLDALTVEEIEGVARDYVDLQYQGEVDLQGDTIGASRDEAIDVAVVCARADADTFHAGLQPILCEERVEWQPDGYPLKILGVLDLVDGTDPRGTPIDLKTGTKKRTALEHALQYVTYDMLLRVKTGQSSGRVTQHGVRALKSGPKTEVDELVIDETHEARVLARYAIMRELVSKGSFAPSPQGWWCSAKWCAYHDRCPYFSGRP